MEAYFCCYCSHFPVTDLTTKHVILLSYLQRPDWLYQHAAACTVYVRVSI